METIGRPLTVPSRAAFAVAAQAVAEQGAPRGAALCIHGFTGTPFEVRPIADALAPHGVSSVGVLLPGHGSTPEELANTTWQDWQNAALAAWDALPGGPPSGPPKILVGCSMGALIALRVAVVRGDAAAIVLLAPALRFFVDGELASRAALHGLWRVLPFSDKEEAGGDIADPAARAANPTYPRIPVRALGQLKLLQREVRADLPRVTAPLCVFHGAQDHTIPPAASAEIAAHVASAHVEHHVLKDSFHVIGIDVDRERIAALTVSFLGRELGWPT